MKNKKCHKNTNHIFGNNKFLNNTPTTDGEPCPIINCGETLRDINVSAYNLAFEKELKRIIEWYQTVKHAHHKQRLRNLVNRIQDILASTVHDTRKKHLIIKNIVSSEINSYNTQRQGYSFLSKYKLHFFADKYFLVALKEIEQINRQYLLKFVKIDLDRYLKKITFVLLGDLLVHHQKI
ncbi:hypothetical protein SD28_03700 [Allofrancisella guangzhouensis]|uniref:Uncharacterized protein n=2 Tax=Allofrancisella guangzhouensis TaxID=594679 RepID=A0A0A8E4B2_9GAMM|nr:hypothetical protein [Allofrancisella guangzhouensis]AJC48799.1 hypothetical protein SD28_03700 [Allofrancisella guangzhouensis]MBK2046033.1 hypothetical protein [Allofrancisella guangzhouensis]